MQLTGSCVTLMIGSVPLLAFSDSIGNTTEEKLKSWSIAAFIRFEEIWNFNDFWKRGNTFDACLTFVNAVQQRWTLQ